MTRQAWDTLTPEQQRAEWDRFQAWQSTQIPAPRAAAVPRPARLRTPKRRGIWPWLVGAWAGGTAILVVIVIAAAMSGSTAPPLQGDMTVVTNTNALTAIGRTEGCSTYGGYDDIAFGAPVTVRDSSDTIIAVGSLGQGQASLEGCKFPFVIADVPDSDFYSVEVTHRGAITVSADELPSGVHLTLGS